MTHGFTRFEVCLHFVCVCVHIYIQKGNDKHSALHPCLWGLWQCDVEGKRERVPPQGRNQPWHPQAVLQHPNRRQAQASQFKHLSIINKKK